MHGTYHGQGTLVTNEFTYVGGFKESVPDGHGTVTYKEGSVRVSKFRNGRAYGAGTISYPDGRVDTYRQCKADGSTGKLTVVADGTKSSPTKKASPKKSVRKTKKNNNAARP